MVGLVYWLIYLRPLPKSLNAPVNPTLDLQGGIPDFSVWAARVERAASSD